MPTALIADDEEGPRAQLVHRLAEAWPDLRIVQEAVNGVDAWDGWLDHEPDVCFLDVRMPGLTGIEVAQRIGGRSHVVFVTAHGDHALAAFDAGAVDYVLKPVDPDRLAQACERVRARLAAPISSPPDLQALLDRLAGQVRKPAPLDLLRAGVGREVRLIPVDDVIFFESDSRYTRVVHAGGEALIRTPLKELVGQLDPHRFWQVHRAVIVRRDAVASAVRGDDGGMTLTLRGRADTLPVSRHFQSLFKAQ